MIFINRLRLDDIVDKDGFNQIVSKLYGHGYKGVIYEFAYGLSEKLNLNFEIESFSDIVYGYENHDFDDEDYWLLAEAVTKDEDLFLIFYQEEFYDELNPHSYIKSGITLYRISLRESIGDGNMKHLANLIGEYLNDYHKDEDVSEENRIETLKWSEVYEGEIIMDENHYGYKDSVVKDYSLPTYSREEHRNSLILNDYESREVIKFIKQSKKIRRDDLLDKFQDRDINIILSSLEEFKAINNEVLIQCRKSNKHLATLAYNDKNSDKLSGIKCAHCGRKFKDEIVTNVYSLDQKFSELLKESHWMTILVTEDLINIGVDRNQIVWGLKDKSDEIDIAFIHKSQFFIVELKDSDFDVGHAYKLNYRSLKFKADYTVICVTGKISDESKELFDSVYEKELEQSEMIGDPSFYKSKNPPIYIENYIGDTHPIDSELSLQSITIASNNVEAEEVLNRFRSITGINLETLIYNEKK